VTLFRSLIPGLFLLVLILSGCRDGRIPCPDIGTKRKLFAFNKNSGAAGKEAQLGQDVSYTKNGLVKKKNYKYLRNKPKRKKYK